MPGKIQGESLNRYLPNEAIASGPYHMEFDSNRSELAKLRNFVRTSLDTYLLPSKITEDFVVAIDEACTNIIRHGYDDNDGYKLSIALSIIGQNLQIVINDYGKSFDINSYPEVDVITHVSSLKKGGLGIHMIREFVDEIHYQPAINSQTPNQLILTKHLI